MARVLLITETDREAEVKSGQKSSRTEKSMSIQKKSLINNLTATKKAIIASSSTVAPVLSNKYAAKGNVMAAKGASKAAVLSNKSAAKGSVMAAKKASKAAVVSNKISNKYSNKMSF